MTYSMLFKCAYGPCVKFNRNAIVHDLAYMKEIELMGVISFLTQLQDS